MLLLLAAGCSLLAAPASAKHKEVVFEAVKLKLTDTKWEQTRRKHNFCNIERSFWESQDKDSSANSTKINTIFTKTLANRSVSVVFMDQKQYISYDKATNTIAGGLFPEVFGEAAKRLGVNWQDTAVVAAPPSGDNETYDAWLSWAVLNYDIVVGDFAATANRRSMGVRFGFPYINESPVLVAQWKVKASPWYVTCFSWTRPFSPGLWVLIIFAVIFTGFMYWLLEPTHCILFQEKNSNETAYPLVHSLWLALAAWVAGEKYKPMTKVGKIFVFSWTFAILLIASSYTSKLSSNLIVMEKESAPLTSLQDAIDRKLGVCVWKNGPWEPFLKARYPDLIRVHPAAGHYDYRAVRAEEAGMCVAMIKDYTAFKVDKGVKAKNGACDLNVVGRPLLAVHGSFATQSDSGAMCTDMISDAFVSTMQFMYNDGYLKEADKRFFKRVHDLTCPEAEPTSHMGGLSVGSAGGIFVLHFTVSIACLIWHHIKDHVTGSRPPNGGYSSTLVAPR